MRAPTMLLDLRGLWLHTVAIVLTVLLAAVAANGVLTARTAAPLIASELDQTATTIGDAVGRQLQRAVSYGIEPAQLVGVEDWFTEIASANRVVTALALYDLKGVRLASVGTVYPAPEAGRELPPGARLFELRDTAGAVVGTLLVACASWAGMAMPWTAGLVVAIGLVVLAALWLTRAIRRRLRDPVRVYDDAAAVLADGSLPRVDIPPPRDPASALLAVLGERVLRVRLRTEALIQKIAEVRAAHFDPQVLQALDEMAVTLSGRLGGAQDIHVEQGSVSRGRLAHRVIIVALVAIGLVAAAMAFDDRLQRDSAARQLAHGATGTLDVAWRALVDQELVQLREALTAVRNDQELATAVARRDDNAVAALLRDRAQAADVQFALFDDDGELLADSGKGDARLDPATTAALESGLARDVQSGPGGLWQDAGRQYQVGVADRIDGLLSDPVYLMATRPMTRLLAPLAARLGAPVAAADLRGQPLAELEPAAQSVVDDWRNHGRRSVIVDMPPGIIAAKTVTGPGGHDLGTLMARLPLPPGSELAQAGVGTLVLLAAAVLALLALGFVNRLFDPLIAAVVRLEQLARGGQGSARPEPGRHSAEVDSLNRSARRLAEKIDALEMLKRSRERQGRRQARFIRHQMMQLAERLDEDARRAILDDLERIEHAGQPATDTTPEDPMLERLVDEFGVLALGFQNLVGRVGAQYQELDRLVHELREALRAKTQFIALQQELEIARNMQLSILPRTFDGHPGVAVQATMLPAKEVGGDFYDFFSLDEHRVALVVADVSGKGVPAAFFMAVSRTLLRAVAQFSESPGPCLVRLNDLLAADNEEMMFVTLFYGILDTRDGSLVYANGGHNPPYVMRADGRVEALPRTNGMALAVMEGMPYTEHRITLTAGDGVFLYTDGVTEACDPALTLFGDDRLIDGLRDMRELPVREIPARVVSMIKTFEAGAGQADDITCLMVRYGVNE